MMKKARLFYLNIILFIVVILALLYFSFLFILPYVFNSKTITLKVEDFIYNKFSIQIISDNLKFKTYSNFNVTISANKLYLADKEKKELLTAKNASLEFNIIKRTINSLNIDYIFINETGFKNLINNNKKKKTTDFKLKSFPVVNIKKAEIWADKGKLNSIFLIISNLQIVNLPDDKTYCTFEAEVVSNLLKNLLSTGKKGYLYIEDNALYAKNFQILMGISSVIADGKLLDDNGLSDFNIKGNNLPVDDIESSLLYFLKLRKPGKQFIENFKDFSGLMDIDLKVTNEGIFGKCTANKLSAVTVLFNVPILFEKAVFNFNKKEVLSKAYGLLGGEKVYSFFNLTQMATENQQVKGIVKSSLPDRFVDKYIPDLSIKGTADACVKYFVKNGKIDVEYLLKLKEGSDLYYKNAYLGLEDKERRLQVKTHKDGDKLYITHYNYSANTDGILENIILGDGLFIKKDGHFHPEYISCKTNGYAPVSVTGSFGRYVDGGSFNGDLNYNFTKRILTGIFTVKDTEYKDFYVEEAKVNANDKKIFIEANGTYSDSPFQCYFEALNKFDTTDITIYNMNLFLDSFIFKEGSFNNPKNSKIKIPEQAKDLYFTIYKWNIKVNKIKRKKIELDNILLEGSLKNNIFKFLMPNINFAKGQLWAKGEYNFKNHSSVIDFSAENIDSNIVADVIFDLPDQIEGIANAKLHLQTKNKLDDIKACASFSIDDGYLPKIGSTEFIIKKSKKVKRPIKIKLSDIINVDITKAKALSSDLKGTFNIDNYKINNVCLTSQQKYLSFLIEGDYDIENKNADLQLWGKYNEKAQKGIKILYIPLSWIIKIIFRPEHTLDLYQKNIDKVPSINAEPEDTKAFRVKFNGDLNGNLNVELKSII